VHQKYVQAKKCLALLLKHPASVIAVVFSRRRTVVLGSCVFVAAIRPPLTGRCIGVFFTFVVTFLRVETTPLVKACLAVVIIFNVLVHTPASAAGFSQARIIMVIVVTSSRGRGRRIENQTHGAVIEIILWAASGVHLFHYDFAWTLIVKTLRNCWLAQRRVCLKINKQDTGGRYKIKAYFVAYGSVLILAHHFHSALRNFMVKQKYC